MKILACDFDGTLYQEQTIDLIDQQAIQHWQQKGNLFIFATGRDVPAIQAKLKNYSLQPDHIIGNNGATIDRQILSKLEPVFIRQLLKKITRVPVPFRELKISAVDSITGKPLSQVLSPTFCPQELLFDQTIITQIAIQMFNRKNAECFATTYGKIFPKLTFFQNNQTVDIVAATTDKAWALNQLAQQLQIAPRNIFTIGDGLNDIQMLKKYQSASFPWVPKDVAQVADRSVQSVSEWITELL
jgi:HAD superfamily hydrolase (TIGR01484 family)